MGFSTLSNATRASVISVAIAAIGFAVLSFIGSTIAAPIAFAIGAIITGITIKLTIPSSSSSVAVETTTLYVGNLPYRANETSVRTLFAEHGQVLSVRLMKDKHTGKRRGFGFVEMPEADAKEAIQSLNDAEYQQRTLKVREANERTLHPAE
ncbi:RNA-binding protein [Moritella sp. Urea-trap-13]|uniref:RNA recognition motif domain-containing protein n=1 Tax=Moritella sp. Urea-trap-13 TaxID=2058327 RepID=UPI000C323A82|nr:RNA-binding protein [Moritella sp. Urea-trap-13]PKH09120.1 RNA-binding protein [Moritella sp. Urea-trap-13]